MRTDWGKLENEYVSGRASYRELAKKYGLSASTIARHGSKDDWPSKRERFATKTHARAREKASAKKAAREAEAMSRVDRLAGRLMDELEKALDDGEQLYRHLDKSPSAGLEEITLRKMDTRAARDMAQTLTALADIVATIGGVMTPKDAAATEIAREKLAIEKEKWEQAKAEASEDESGGVKIEITQPEGEDYGA